MWSPRLFALTILCSSAAAQTPDGFNPSASAQLRVVYGSKAVDPPGTSFTKAETASMPVFGSNDNLSGTYLFVMIDLDVQRAGGNRQNLLHAMIRDVKPSGKTSAEGFQVLSSTATGPTAYLGPSPPAGQPAHRYTFLLFEQPANFAVPAGQRQVLNSRVGFDMNTFAQQAGLAAPLYGNFLNVTG
ncbi:hypothetical protein MCOR27_002635 [Pyricularia oryzae]|uniref:PEBP-like protein n=3 Tax=Pyricularia TaxID=48558 RepID=A0ABQ8NIU2_PYRGI|nr:uncharacterized protein MGG_05054 [Pyricularia oryzae 70-15]KAH8847948.1 hypothetical protein MCOR01_001344 [Pyricularia oryzae]KAI6297802.1 hypothetical protein MCOR33_005974 [Pyricularia grisea]EHA52759.1 hypothetical protein MGG_05054 [Pyricularia oryzae 70-15]KAH9430112.1 hypothetical protein MCOR02_009831 [Pyricularia oryzae]KAI6258626.1 hypothetical protein MCOR19_005009 [Pyricularia oryzae]